MVSAAQFLNHRNALLQTLVWSFCCISNRGSSGEFIQFSGLDFSISSLDPETFLYIRELLRHLHVHAD